MTRPQKEVTSNYRSDVAASLRKGLLLAAGFLVAALPPALPLQPSARPPSFAAQAPQSAPVVTAPALKAKPPTGPIRHADFGRQRPRQEVRQMANWVVHSRDHQKMSFVIVDKKGAKVYLFNPKGRLVAATPALMGSAVGDDTAPGVGDKPLSQVLPQEKTTPAGRFIAEVGVNTKGEDIVWVDYDAAVSMHRVRANVKAERRLQRLASPTAEDNRISFGCINLPVPFYEKVLKPAVQRTGTVVYVLPETRPLHETFASFFDVDARIKVAGR